MKKIQKTLFMLIYTLFVMTAGWAATKTWVGGDSSKPTDWDTPGNWSPTGVPNAGDTVIINSGVNQPVIENHIPSTKKVEIHSIEVKTGATLKIIAKQRNIEFIGTSNFLISGQIVLELREGTVRYVKISNTDFTGSPKILIDSPLTPLINSAYHTKLEASGNIHFKQASIITADHYANDDKLIINSPKTTIAGSFTVDSKLEIENSSGVLLDITGTFTAKRSVNITDSANTIIRSSVEQSDGTLLGGTVNLTENLTLNNATWTTSKGEVKTKGDFEVPNFKQTGGTLKLEGTSTQNLKIDKAHNLTFTGNVVLDKPLIISGNFTSNGDFDAGTRSVTFNGAYSQISGSAASHIVFTELIVSGSKALAVTKDITIKERLTNEGTFTAAGKTVKLEPSSGLIKITGTNTAAATTFGILSLRNTGGKTLEIGGKITADDLNISGTPSNKLTVQGVGTSSEITLTSDQIPDPVSKKGYYLKVNTNIPVTDGHTFYIANSELVEPKSSNWKSMASTWKTTTGSDNWNVPANWTPAAVPAADWPVIIPAGGSGATYPKLNPTSPSNPAAQASSVTVETGAKLDLGAEIIQDSGAGSAVTAHITNKGILKMIGTTGNSSNPGQKEWLEINNSASNNDNITHGPGSTIEYYGALPANPTIWEGPYQNLRVGDAKTGLNTGSLVVNGYFTVIHDVGANFTVTADSQHYKNSVLLYKPTIFTSNSSSGIIFEEYINTNGSSITFDGSGTIQTKKDISISPPSGNITVNAGTGAWTSSGGTIRAHNITVKRNWTSNGFVRAEGNITADNASHDNTWTAGDVTLKGSLTAAQFNQTSGTLTFNGTGTPEQELNFTGAGNKNIRNLTVDNGITPPASNAKVKLLSPVMIAGNFTNKGTFNANSKDISLDGSFTNSGIFNTGTGNSLVFNSTFTNNGTFNADAGTIVFTGNAFTNSGTFIAGTNNTVNLSPSGDIAITGTGIAGNTKFHTLKLTNAGGKTLTINGKITVDDLNISGTSSASKLTVQGSSPSDFNIELTSDQIPDPVSKKGYYLDVKRSVPIKNGYIYYVAQSDLDTPNPKNWQHMAYTWKTTAATTAWGNSANWTPEIIPTADWPVIIPAGAANYPILVADTSAQSVTVEANAELTLGNSVIKKGSVTAKLTNYGTIKLTGTGNQKNWFGAGNDDKIDLKAGSTVEYYGASTANVWEGPYKKLKISGSRNDLRAVSLTVDQYLITDHDGVTITTTSGQTYHGNVQAYEGASYYQLTLATTGTDTIKTSRGVTTGNLTVNGKWEAGDQNNSATVEVNGNLNVSGDIASVNSSITAKKVSGSGGNITVNGAKDWRCWGNITAEGDMTIHNMKATGGTIAVHGNMTAHTFHLADYGKLYFNGSSPQNLNFTDTAGSQIRELEIGSSSTLNLGSSIKITHILTNKGRFTAGNHTVTLSKADRIDNSDPNTVPPTRITITGTSAAANTQFKDLICTDSYIKKLTINKNISVNGSLKLQGQSAASPLTVAGGTSDSEITLNSHKTGGKWLSVHTNIPITGTTGGADPQPCTYTAEESLPDGTDNDILAGKPDNWIFTNYRGDISWTGKKSEVWADHRNWTPYSIPGKQSAVKIPIVTTKYPKLTAAGAEAASVTVNSGATLDLAGEIIQDSGTGGTARAHINNLGTLRMTGTSGQKQWLEIDNTNDNIAHYNNSAIEYYGTSTAAIWKGPYKNLNLRRSVENIDSVSGSEKNIQVDGKTNIYGNLTIKGATQTYTGDITATASDGTGRGNITFDTVMLLKTNNITAGSITVNGSWELGTSGTPAAVQANGTVTVTGNWNSYGSITAQGTGNITANGNWTSSGEIIANGDITVDNAGNNNKWQFSGTQIRVKGNLTAAEFIQTDGVLSFRKPDSPAAKTLLFRHPDTSEINNLTIEGGTDGNAELTLGSDVRIKGWFLNKGIFNHGDKTINFIGSSSSIGKGDSEPGNITEFYNLTIINGAVLKPWKDFKVKNAFLNNGTFAHGNKKLTFTGNNASIGKGDSEPGNITEFYDIEIAAPPNPQTTPPRNPKLTLYQNINLKNSLTNNGTFDAVTKTKTVNLNTDAGGTVTITGNTDETKTNFHTLQFTGAGGKKLQINKKITVAESLNLEGTARGNLLTVNGASDSYITLGKNMLGGKWLNVKTNIPIKVGFTYTTEESKPDGSDDDINSGKPKNWIFNNCISLMTWTAAAAAPDKTKWDNRENWIPRGIPGQYTPVMIPKEKQAYPKLESGTNAKAASVTLNGELDLDSYLISDDDGGTSRSPVTNNGLLKMIGTAGSLADQKAWLELPASDTGNCIIHNSGSKIEYYGSTNNPVWAGPYKNLILGENRANLTAGDLKVSETLTVDSNTRNPITITANNQTYEGLVTLRNNTVFNSTDANGTVFNEKIEAAGFDITLDGTGPIQTKKEVNANNIKANMGAGSWTSSGAIATTENIDAQRNWKSSGTVSVAGNITASSDWTSSADITVNGNITADNSSHNNTWTVESGNISLKGNFNANKFMPLETAGTLIFNGNTQTINLIDTASIVRKLQIESSSSVSLLSPLTLISSFENKGKFDASGQDVTLKPEDTITITGTNNEKDTQFYNLLCEDQGGKTFSVINKIWVEEKMYLSGSYVSPAIVPLNVTGQKGAIYLNAPHSVSEDEIDNVRQKYLKVWPDNVMINEGNINEKFYVAAESTDNENTTKNQKGWVFYKSFELVNSFARPNENKIYLLFKNGSSNDIDIVLEENDLAAPKSSPLKIKKGISDVDIYTKNDSRAPKKLNLSSIPERHTFWEFTIDDKVSPDWILDPNAIVYLDYYGKRKEKYRISDIGINMVTPQLAFNSVILRNFDAADDDNPLPRLDVRIPTEKAAASSNIILHFFSDTVKHKFWHPDFITFPQNISISAFAESKSQTSPYPYTFENKLMTFIIPETDAYLKPETVGSFMYVYDGWLPCARLLDSNDMLSFDAWHFKIVGVRKQRGGVSIFNNVVNPHKGEEAIITPHLKKAGTLTIQIMTIDGSVVRTLERSYKAAGDHIYKWDGRNNGGNPVASGIYFVRIAGPDIDEMRKILVIK